MQTARPSEGGLGLDLDSIRRVTGLGDCTPYDVLEEFTDAAARDGSLSLAAFTQCFDAIVDVSLMSAVESSSFHQVRCEPGLPLFHFVRILKAFSQFDSPPPEHL